VNVFHLGLKLAVIVDSSKNNKKSPSMTTVAGLANTIHGVAKALRSSYFLLMNTPTYSNISWLITFPSLRPQWSTWTAIGDGSAEAHCGRLQAPAQTRRGRQLTQYLRGSSGIRVEDGPASMAEISGRERECKWT
jgi:hypothetical protein